MTLAYGTSGHLSGANCGAGSFSYGYVTDSELLSSLTGPQVTTTYAYEPNRDLRIEVLNQIGTTVISRYGYRSDGIARRKDRVKEGTAFAAGVYDRFAYNDRNEVTLSRNYTGTNPDGASDPETVALARQFSYDAIGNRLTSQNGTSSSRGHTSNALNQYTALTNPSASPIHDLDGNLTQDGIWTYTWDAEGRVVAMATTPTAVAAGFTELALRFVYDHLGPRVRKEVFGEGSALVSRTVWIYDGWNMIAEYDQPAIGGALTLKRSYAWGLDLLGSLRDSGGVGALLQLRDYSENATYLAGYDGNGNLTTLQNAATGTLAANYEYGPYGEPIATSGAYADKNPVRFSTKYTDDETGLVYYGRRYYDPRNGRFVGRDPIEEEGGLNLYGFVRNNPVNAWDYLGMNTFFIWEPYYDDAGNMLGTRMVEHDEPLVPSGRARGDDRIDTQFGYLSAQYFKSWGVSNGWRTGDLTNPFNALREAANASVLFDFNASKPIDLRERTYGRGDAESTAAVAAYLDMLRGLKLPDGALSEIAKRIAIIEESGFSATIYSTNELLSNAFAWPIHRDGGPTGGYVLINPREIWDFGSRSRGTYSDPLGALSHELTHVSEYITSGYVRSLAREFEAVRVENQVRAIMGFPLREFYDDFPVPNHDQYVPQSNAPPVP